MTGFIFPASTSSLSKIKIFNIYLSGVPSSTDMIFPVPELATFLLL